MDRKKDISATRATNLNNRKTVLLVVIITIYCHSRMTIRRKANSKHLYMMTLIHHAPPITEHSYLTPSISILPTPKALYCTLCPPSCNATTPCISIHCHQTNTSSPSSLLPHCSSSPSHVHLWKDAEICYKMVILEKVRWHASAGRIWFWLGLLGEFKDFWSRFLERD